MSAAKTRHAGSFHNPISHQIGAACLPTRSSHALGWEHIQVEQFQHPPGECSSPVSEDHTICLSLAARTGRLL